MRQGRTQRVAATAPPMQASHCFALPRKSTAAAGPLQRHSCSHCVCQPGLHWCSLAEVSLSANNELVKIASEPLSAVSERCAGTATLAPPAPEVESSMLTALSAVRVAAGTAAVEACAPVAHNCVPEAARLTAGPVRNWRSVLAAQNLASFSRKRIL